MGKRLLRWTPPRPAPTAAVGFTLIEVMVSLAVTMTVFLAILSMFNTSFRLLAGNKKLTVATNLATRKLAEFKEITLPNIVTGGDCVDRESLALPSCDTNGDGLTDGGAYERIWVVSNIDVDGDGTVDLVGDLVKVSLTVSWAQDGRSHSVSMATLTTGKPQ